MFSRLILAVFLVLSLAGCATTGKSTNTQGAQELQNQVQELQGVIESVVFQLPRNLTNAISIIAK